MYGWIGKNFYNHRVILTSTIEFRIIFMLSLVLAVSTVFTTTAVSEKKVSAQAEIKNKKQLQR